MLIIKSSAPHTCFHDTSAQTSNLRSLKSGAVQSEHTPSWISLLMDTFYHRNQITKDNLDVLVKTFSSSIIEKLVPVYLKKAKINYITRPNGLVPRITQENIAKSYNNWMFKQEKMHQYIHLIALIISSHEPESSVFLTYSKTSSLKKKKTKQRVMFSNHMSLKSLVTITRKQLLKAAESLEIEDEISHKALIKSNRNNEYKAPSSNYISDSGIIDSSLIKREKEANNFEVFSQWLKRKSLLKNGFEKNQFMLHQIREQQKHFVKFKSTPSGTPKLFKQEVVEGYNLSSGQVNYKTFSESLSDYSQFDSKKTEEHTKRSFLNLDENIQTANTKNYFSLEQFSKAKSNFFGSFDSQYKDQKVELEFENVFICTPDMKKLIDLVVPMIGIDATHIKNTNSKMVLITATALLPTSAVVPLACGLYTRECAETYSNFLSKFQAVHGSEKFLNASFISDGDKGIRVAIKCIFPKNTHFLCYTHVQRSIKYLSKTWGKQNTDIISAHLLKLQTFNDEALAKSSLLEIDSILSTILNLENKEVIDALQSKNPEAPAKESQKTQVTISALRNPKLCSWAHAPSPKFNQITNNSAEVYNSLTRAPREEGNLIKLLFTIFNSPIESIERDYKLNFQDKMAGLFIYDDTYLIPSTTKMLCCQLEYVSSFRVKRTRNKNIVTVSLVKDSIIDNCREYAQQYGSDENSKHHIERFYQCHNMLPYNKFTRSRVLRSDQLLLNTKFQVDLKEKTCTCLYFQQNQIPCVHALAAILKFKLKVSTYCLRQHHMDFYIELLLSCKDRVLNPSVTQVVRMKNLVRDIHPMFAINKKKLKVQQVKSDRTGILKRKRKMDDQIKEYHQGDKEQTLITQFFPKASPDSIYQHRNKRRIISEQEIL